MADPVVEETTPPEGTDPKAAKVEKEIEKVVQEEVKIEEKLDDPKVPDAEKAKLEERLTKLDEKLDKLGEQLGKLSASPVAPAPRKVGDAPAQAPENPTGPGTTPETEKPKGKAYVSSTWFGNRAYSTD